MVKESEQIIFRAQDIFYFTWNVRKGNGMEEQKEWKVVVETHTRSHKGINFIPQVPNGIP